jgi:drug/metabolite transporter (DMT)-like permease
MSFMFPALGAVLQTGSVTVDKVTMSIKNFTYKNYTVISFPLIFIFNLIIYLIFRPKLYPTSITGLFVLFLFISILLTIVTNILFYRALKSDGLGEIEVITMLSRVPVILFAGLIFVDERNYLTMTLAFLATLALIWSHWERHHFHIAKKTWPLLLATLIISPFGAILAKELLLTWNPISLQLVSNGVLGLFFLILYYKHIKTTPGKAIPLLLITNLLTTVSWILYYFSYQASGIIYTALIFSIQPALVYLASIFFLKEKHHWKKTIGFIVILAAITLAQIL